MKVPAVIPKDRNLHQSEDYYFLRQEGIRYVEQLASAIWTDYNLHDPGITLLEALCFAITDLGYRTQFPIKDLLARPGDDYSQSIPPIFTAREILTSNPWTETDFRKMLVDIAGIRNAWLLVCDGQEVDFYADCKKSSLSFFEKNYRLDKNTIRPGSPQNDLIKKWIDEESNTENEKIKMALHLEFPDPNRGDLLQRQTVEVSLPGWKEVDTRFDDFFPFLNHDVWEGVEFSGVVFNTQSNTWQGDIKVNYQLEKTGSHAIVFQNILVENVTETTVKEALEKALISAGADNVLRRYHQHLLGRLARLSEHTVRLRGLYDVLLELETDDTFGDLNSPLVHYRLMIPVVPPPADGTGKLEELRLDILFPEWQVIYDDLEAWYPFLQSSAIVGTVVFENDFGLVGDTWRTDIRFQYDGQEGRPDIMLRDVVIEGVKNAAQLAAVKANIQSKTEGSILGVLHGKWKKTLAIVEEVERRLHENRNFCEDFKRIANVGVNEVALCADIEVEAGADLEKVLAQIFFEIENYLSPPVRFYTLKEMVDKKVPAEDIFNGPPLDHGFIISEELEKTGLDANRKVYASDMVNIIMDVPGVLAVKDLLLTKYDRQGRPVLPSERWCLSIDPRHKAQLIRYKSKILFFKDQLPYVLSGERFDKMEKELARLFALADRSKLLRTPKDFPLPKGRPADITTYYPLRELLPKTYGVGEGDLPDSATEKRKAQAKQLQAYLAFFDQLLANYLSQLAHLRDLFSCDEPVLKNLQRTYYTQFLSAEKLGANLWTDAATLEDAAGTAGPGSLQRLAETEQTYLDRRNRFLDHLLARFAEQFTDYALLLESAAGLQDPRALIRDKVVFLKNYPVVSSQRGKGFNYKDPARLWDTDNVPGLQKRVAGLLGIENADRRFLYCPSLRDGFVIDDLGGGVFSFHLTDKGTKLLSSSGVFSSQEEAWYAIEILLKKMYDPANYLIVEEGGQFSYRIGEVIPVFEPNPDTSEIEEIKTMPHPDAESEASFATAEEANEAATSLFQKISEDAPGGEYCKTEGLHILEHILLRPKHEFHDHFMEVCLEEDCRLCGNEDPYSFRATVVLPFWMERFLDEKMKIREYVQRLLRLEAPAHVHLKICWVDNRQMRELEWRYRRWLEENARRFPDPAILSQRLNDLLDILGRLRNVYFEGYLHDCDDSEEVRTIILNKSFLGGR